MRQKLRACVFCRRRRVGHACLVHRPPSRQSRRRNSTSPGRFTSAGCPGPMPRNPASSRNGPTNTASPSTSSRSTTISNRSTIYLTAGKFDGVTVTNMDALTIPAAGGVRHQRHHHGRLFQRQRRCRAQDGQDPPRDQRPEDQYRRAFGVALSAGAGAFHDRPGGKGHQDAQHVGRRHRRRVQIGRLDGRGHLEPAAHGSEGRAKRYARLRLEQGSRRDRRSAGDQYRDAEGQSRSRQGAGRHLVRDSRP